MQISLSCSNSSISFGFSTSDADRIGSQKIRLDLTQASFGFSESVGEIHGDLLALAAFLCTSPWLRKRMIVAWAVSDRMRSAVKEALGIELRGVGSIPPRTITNGRPGLAYSGGVDSSAALAVLPASSQFFLERVAPAGKPWLGAYKKDAALYACQYLRQKGYDLSVCQSDVEYVRSPHGFPDHLSCVIPAVLMADNRHLDAISCGTIAEAAYTYGNVGVFADFANRRAYTAMNAVFEAAGLPLYNPVIGVSEVGTAIIAQHWEHGHIAQSCMRGSINKPCMFCFKCFRKRFTEAALTGNWPSNSQVDHLFEAPEVQKALTARPIKLENVMAFFTSRYDGSHPKLKALKRRVRGGIVSVNWMTQYFGPSLDMVPSKYHSEARAGLDRYLSAMTLAEENQMRDWDSLGWSNDGEVLELNDALMKA
jgi:Family of unknown function (DUF6395)